MELKQLRAKSADELKSHLLDLQKGIRKKAEQLTK